MRVEGFAAHQFIIDVNCRCWKSRPKMDAQLDSTETIFGSAASEKQKFDCVVLTLCLAFERI